MKHKRHVDKMIHVKFTRGSKVIHYINSYIDFETADFLKSSLELEEEPTKSEKRGIQRTKKKKNKTQRLAILVPQSRHLFWEETENPITIAPRLGD
ncbi:hypothetical protein PoB_000506300 [Plakobranchus ocellatus]|uniref:Uncharacterized protein n=1 Tax=Plakobranchus ocellatus TaxID=259542 RepID=A0AAV3Y7S7_9GAST|nr:hypothetical protein PoB_000506300 [Plakobranchus ocellatus]